MDDFISTPEIPNQYFNLTRKIELAGKALKKDGKAIQVKNPDELKKACSDLESLFIFQLFKTMRATIPKSGFIDGGRAEEIYTSMLDSEISKNVTGNTGMGLASVMYEQLAGNLNKSGESDDNK